MGRISPTDSDGCNHTVCEVCISLYVP